MAKSKPEQAPSPSSPSSSEKSEKARPVFEARLGRVKACVWANETESGVRHNVTVRRLFKRDGSANWEQSDSFGRDDLPVVMEVVRQAWVWIYAQGS
jgi:hypothetical protein